MENWCLVLLLGLIDCRDLSSGSVVREATQPATGTRSRQCLQCVVPKFASQGVERWRQIARRYGRDGQVFRAQSRLCWGWRMPRTDTKVLIRFLACWFGLRSPRDAG